MARTSLHIDPRTMRYQALIGTGGIGAGSLFLMTGNQTLGREESRGGKYLDARDYCKLHIISHYVKLFCGEGFPVFPIGKIGDDDVGRRIFGEMQQAGLNMDYVHTSPGDKTLFGFCFLYPDGTGGNLTTEESACTKVDDVFIRSATPVFSRYAGKLIALSAPEIPMDARKELLKLAQRYNGYTVASFTSGEMKEARESGMLAMVDLLAMNIDEAAALAEESAQGRTAGQIVEKTLQAIRLINPAMRLSLTAGKNGSWTWDGAQLKHVGVAPVQVKSSAGAGDAHIAGVISGLVAGLTLQQSQVLGTLAGGFSVMSQHTIHPEMSAHNLKKLALVSDLQLDSAVRSVLNDAINIGHEHD